MFSRVNPPRGFTVLESVLASFILLTAIALTVLSVDASLKSQVSNERRLAAVREAENALEQMRAEAADDYLSLKARLEGGTWLSSDPSITLKTYVERQEIVSPSKVLESDYQVAVSLPDVGQKVLKDSALKVEIEARFGKAEKDKISLFGYIADSRPNNFSLRILPRTGVAANSNGTLEFSAVATDARSQRIDDLILTWYVEPRTSFGTIFQVSRDGQECVYMNTYENYDGVFTSSPGTCRVVVRAVYKGREVTHSVEVTNNN